MTRLHAILRGNEKYPCAPFCRDDWEEIYYQLRGQRQNELWELVQKFDLLPD